MRSSFDLDDYVFRALQAGAAGFLLKDMIGEDIVTAVRQASRGVDSLLAPALTKRLIERFTTLPSGPAGAANAVAELTSREQEVLRLVARGMSNGEIATHLVIAETRLGSN
jgi:DNA-binding NarL/FixJ family response regulator